MHPCLSALVLGFALVVGVRGAVAAEFYPGQFAHVDVAATKTSIYVGTVTMTMPRFTRVGERYETTYAAKVFPYFFSNESGRLHVEIPDEALQRLSRGEPIEFKGQAVRTDGAERRIEGKATPLDARSGKIKVRVFVSKRIELIFNTTYHFPEPPGVVGVPAIPPAAER
ncbi:hypothetical protein [Horticoccus sp. 23ND18S-11]|uniref:hypothetical protein n=1 Tax=Horticoccus sp. 23ND18S-11 TaxID=3391832 RepID=UPI0039C99ABD